MKNYRLITLCCLCLVACVAPNPSGEPTSIATTTTLDFAMPPETNVMQPGTLPTPYTADEIRAANPPGSWKVYRITKDELTLLQRFEFVASGDPAVSAIDAEMREEGGTEIKTDQTRRASWSELQAHASFAAAQTVMGRDQLVLKAGRFDCWTYAVESPGDAISTFWFARDLPGPPVLLVTRVEGKQRLRMELEAFNSGEESEPMGVLIAREVYMELGARETYLGGPKFKRTSRSGMAALLEIAAHVAATTSSHGSVSPRY